MLDHIRAQIVAEGIGIPLCPSPTDAARHPASRRHSLPANCQPFLRSTGLSRASDIGPRAAPSLAAGKAWQHMAFHLGQTRASIHVQNIALGRLALCTAPASTP